MVVQHVMVVHSLHRISAPCLRTLSAPLLHPLCTLSACSGGCPPTLSGIGCATQIVLGGGLWHSAWPRGGAAAWKAQREAAAMEEAAKEAEAIEVEQVCTSARDSGRRSADRLAPEAGSLSERLPEAHARSAPSLASLVGAACVVRLVLLPAIAVPLTAAAASAGLLPRRPMLLIVSHIQSAVPSSQTLVAMLHERGESALAARVSRIYLPQYAMSVLTVAAVIVLAIQIIEGAGMAQVPMVAPHDATSTHT